MLRYSISGQSAGKVARAAWADLGRVERRLWGSFSQAPKSPPGFVRMPDWELSKRDAASAAKVAFMSDVPVMTFTR